MDVRRRGLVGPVDDGGDAVIDAHQHFWTYDPADQDWMTSEMDALRRDFLPPDLAPLLRDADVEGTVAVQARRAEVETTWLCGLADAHPFILGVVGWVDMAAPGLEARLEAFAAHPRLVGMREVLHDLPDPDHAATPGHVAAVAAIGRVGLVYDLLVRTEGLAAATRLVDACPGQRFVVDHIAKPPRANDGSATAASLRDSAWGRGLRALAERPHVACKLSGLVTEVPWSTWRRHDATPYLDLVVEAFGPDRCLIGSDWPVCTLAAPYGEALGLVAGYVRRFSEDEGRAMTAGTARAWYGLARREVGNA